MSGHYELPYEPKEDEYVIADCCHEVYEGESIYIYDGKAYCPDCWRGYWYEFIEKWPEDFAGMVNADTEKVEKKTRTWRI